MIRHHSRYHFQIVTQGALKIALGSSITSALKAGRYSYDVLLNDGSLKTRIVSGSAIVTAGVTTG